MRRRRTYASTFYPGAPTPEMAAPVQVAAGSQLTGIDIRLRKTHIVRVTGRVVGRLVRRRDGRGRGGVTVTLMPKENGRHGVDAEPGARRTTRRATSCCTT